MALLDFLKKKKDAQKAKEKKSAPVGKIQKKSQKVSVATEKPQPTSAEKKENVAPKTKPGKEGKFSYTIIREPHISEKGSRVAQENQYIFKVYESSNKPEIKKTIEGMYSVNVLSVNIIKVPRKKRRLGRTQGFRKGYTKAIVTVKAGQKIEIF